MLCYVSQRDHADEIRSFYRNVYRVEHVPARSLDELRQQQLATPD